MAIGFGFSDEQELYREQIRRFGREVLVSRRGLPPPFHYFP